MRRTIDRWTQGSLLMAGVLWSVVWAHRASVPIPGPDEVKPGGELFDLRVVASLGLFTIGMAGVQSARARSTGRTGAVGFGLICLGVVFMGAWVYEALDFYPLFVLGGMTVLIGAVLFTVVALRAKTMSIAAAGPLLFASLLFIAVNPDNRQAYLAVPLGIAWVWLAYTERRVRLSGNLFRT